MTFLSPKTVKLAEQSVRWNLYIPVSVAQKVEARLQSAYSSRVPYGMKSELIVRLLNHFLTELDKLEEEKGKDGVESLLPLSLPADSLEGL